MKKVLVVEDDNETCAFLKVLLEAEGYEVTCASNGLEALKKIDVGSPPDLLLTDLAMPVMDGVELSAVVRNRLNIPVLLISAHNLPSRKVWDHHLAKPLDIDRLLSTVRSLLGWTPDPRSMH